MWVSCKNHVDDLWRLSSPIPNQSSTSQSRLLRNFFSEVLTMTCLHISFTDFTSGPNFLRSNFSVAFCPTPAHLWGAWFCLLFGPLLGSCRQQRLFPLPSLLKLNNPSCFSISSYVMCSSPVHLGGSPPDSCSKVVCCSSCASRKCWLEGKNCLLDLLAMLLLLLPGYGQPSLLKNVLLLSGNGCFRALCVCDKRWLILKCRKLVSTFR